MGQETNFFRVFLSYQTRKGKKGIELRRITTNKDAVKIIIHRALLDQPITVFPTFNDKLRALATLQEKGVIKFNPKSNKYDFLI